MSQNKDRWSSLSMKERMFLMQEYVKNGITDLTSMRKHYNGIPYSDLNTSNYDYFNASPDMEPKKEGQHWDSRNSETGRILKREDHPTFDLAVKGENEAGYVIRRGIDGNLYSLPKNINYVEENIFASGGDSNTEKTSDNEYYYDYIEPSITKAFDSTEDYNRYYGDLFGRNITKKAGRLARKTGKIAYDIGQFIPKLGTVLDLGEMVYGDELSKQTAAFSTGGSPISALTKLDNHKSIRNFGGVWGTLLQAPDFILDLYTLYEDIKRPLSQYANGGRILDGKTEDNQTLDNEGGWSDNSRARRERRHDKYDPTGNYILQPLYMLMGGNQAAGEENEYWKAYLGLKNAVPKMNPNAKTSWDDAIEAEKIANGELPSDFYGTTPRMDLNIQAVADTLNTGKILRNYDKYKEGRYYFPTKRTIEEIYKTGKRILENPNTWQQVEGDNVAIKAKPDDTIHEYNPLGMLADFGMMWDPKTKSIYVHDTYDFGPISQIFAGKRPKEMKIRSKISFDPAKGSKLLRNDLENYYDYPKALTTHAYGGRILSGEESTESTLSGNSVDNTGIIDRIKGWFNKNQNDNNVAVIDDYEDPTYITYRNAPKSLRMYLTQTKNGKYDIGSKGEYGDTHYDAVEARYFDLTRMMKKKGFSNEEINRLSPFLVTQMILEGGYKTTSPNNNFGGMLDPKTRAKIKFDTEDDFYSAYLDNLDEKWGDAYLGKGLGWRNAKTIEDYARIINREDLKLDTLDKFNEYNNMHKDKPAYLYTPVWENNGTELMSDTKFGGIKDRVNGLIQLINLRQAEFRDLSQSMGWLKTMPLEEMLRIGREKYMQKQ